MAALPSQLHAYVHLTAGVARDVASMWTSSLALYALFWRVVAEWEHYWPDLGLTLYGVYVLIRTLFLGSALVGSALLAPGSSAFAPALSRRHLLWSYWLGHVGLTVRCFRYDAIKWMAREALNRGGQRLWCVLSSALSCAAPLPV